MTFTIPPELEKQVRERAQAEGLSFSAYLEKLIREDDLRESEIQAALNEGFEQLDSGDLGTPAEDFFEELRVQRGLRR